MKLMRHFVRFKTTAGIKSTHFWVILVTLAVFTWVYYVALKDFHDIYLVLFFYPLVHAAFTFRLRGVVVSGLAILTILLPYTLLFSHDAYALARIMLFATSTIIISALLATLLNYLEAQLVVYDEIVSLNEELNGYIKRLTSTQKQLIQSERLAAIGQLAASVAHEINNPLAGVLVYSRLMMRKLTGGSINKEEVIENLAKIEKAINHCSHIIKSLLDFSRQSEPELTNVNLENVIKEIVTLIDHQAEMNHVNIRTTNISDLPEITADVGQLQQVLVNLAINAIQAMPDGGELSIQGSVSDNSWLKISVEDTGCGISPENIDKLFTPFFTTKEQGKGTGLGLAVSYGIIERHGGRIDVQSKIGEGSTFTVCLPR